MPGNKAINRIVSRVGSELSLSSFDVQSSRGELVSLWECGIDRISDANLKRSISNFYEARVPSQFFIAPSSSTGNHHPSWHNDQGGIVRHLTESCVMLEALLNSFGFNALKRSGSTKEYNDMKDIVLAATLISDTFKNGNPWGDATNRDHGRIAADVWWRVAIGCDVSKDLREKVYEAAACHYGRFTPLEEPKELDDFPVYVKIVHLADSISSSRVMAYLYSPLSNVTSPPEEK